MRLLVAAAADSGKNRRPSAALFAAVHNTFRPTAVGTCSFPVVYQAADDVHLAADRALDGDIVPNPIF